MVGNAFTTGSRQNSIGHVRVELLAAEEPIDVQELAVGGTGYAVGPAADPDDTFATRAASVDPAADAVLLLSRNDIPSTEEDVYAAATAAFAAARTAAPDAALVVVGPSWMNATPPPEVLTAAAGVRRAATEAGAGRVDPVQAAWFADPALFDDDVHPNDAGQEVLLERLRPRIEDVLDL
ncbi:MAG: hypothetical protein JWP66_1900 [Naasia sp.]|nr:hypothetical protein [Naasia sp.]